MGEFQKVSSRLWVARVLVLLLIVLAGLVPAYLFTPVWVPILIVVLGVILAIYIIIEVRFTAWKTGKYDVIVRKGRLWQTVSYVPFGRVQYFEVTRSLLGHCFGYVAIEIHTASVTGNVTIPGISAQEADDLRQHLSERTRAEIGAV